MSFLNQATLDQVNASYEYIAIFGIILLESAGIPLPGETILIGAAVYAGSHQTLDSLPKTGIFQISAGDYRRFRSRSGQFGSPETDSQFAKARHWRAFLRLQRVKSPGAGLPGWGGRIRTSIWRIENRAFSPLREKPQNLFPLKFISNSKRSIFENRIESVKSRAWERNGPFGE